MNRCLLLAILCVPLFAYLSYNGNVRAHRHQNWAYRAQGESNYVGFAAWLVLDLIEIALLLWLQSRRARGIPVSKADEVICGFAYVTVLLMILPVMWVTTVF